MLLHNLIHQCTDAGYHVVEGHGNGACLPETLLLYGHIQVTGFHLAHGILQVTHGARNPVGHDRCHREGKHCRTQQNNGNNAYERILKLQDFINIRHAHQSPTRLVQRCTDKYPFPAIHPVTALANQKLVDCG